MNSESNSGIGTLLKRELVRTALERAQTLDVAKLTELVGRNADVLYEDVEESLNIPYINREEIPLAMDVFKPKSPKTPEMPVIVTIHGGGLTIGDRQISRPFARLLAHKGYLVFSIEYRLAPRADVSQQLDDICAGLDFVGIKLVEYDVDFDRIFLAAESSGAFLALYAAAMKKSKKLQDAIGYQPSRFCFRALGLNCGMFYTNGNDPTGWILADQIYGEKRSDPNFLACMNPENEEIISNLPPVFLSTSRGDFMNDYSFRLHEALKKAEVECRFVYYPDEELKHAFMALQNDHPLVLECVDKMLAWFDEQAELDIKRRKRNDEITKRRRALARRMSAHTIDRQNIASYVKERNSVSPAQQRATALIDCSREYTYEEMFREWERCAAVFSELGMTGEENSRVGIAGTISAEPLFAFYGLNLTGACVSMLSYPDFLPGGQWRAMVKREKLTDLILSDIMVTPDLLRELKEAEEELGIRHIILLHSRLGGPCTGPAELVFNELNYHVLRRMPGIVYMEELLAKYGSGTPKYSVDDADSLAIILHTSGTTKGSRKPLPYTNRAVNSVATNFGNGFHGKIRNYRPDDQLRVAPCFDFSSFMCMCGLVNTYLALTDTVVLTFFGAMHPKYVKALEYYRLNIVFSSGFMMDKWIESRYLKEADLSFIKVFACGGSYLPPAKVKKYNAFLREHGSSCKIYRGYGMSETGGAELYVPLGNEEDILGFPRPKENFRILDEEDGIFHTADDGTRTGIMFVASDSLCMNTLDGETLFDYTKIDGRDFICTNDRVRVNEDGSFSYAGRADRYFVNNDGVRFDAGKVEVQMTRQPGIARCAVVPVLDKRIHDTVPVLYIVAEEGRDAVETVRSALMTVFAGEGPLSGTVIPSQFVLVDDIPCNANGKIDVFRITRERLEGSAYDILPVHDEGRVTDIRCVFTKETGSITAGTLPEGMEGRSAFNLFDLFNSGEESRDGASAPCFLPWAGMFGKRRGIPPEMSKELQQLVMQMQGVLYNRKDYDSYIEE